VRKCFTQLAADCGILTFRPNPLREMHMQGNVLKGLSASPGVLVGQAAVAEQPGTAIRVGGVLVIKHSSLEWFEAITQVGAVVTEFGGRTSHAATICRELGKPCVTAVANVTALVNDGQWLSVDGEAGTVTILPS
jgi:phosphohistidine swiveling domain-containing protein